MENQIEITTVPQHAPALLNDEKKLLILQAILFVLISCLLIGLPAIPVKSISYMAVAESVRQLCYLFTATAYISLYKKHEGVNNIYYLDRALSLVMMALVGFAIILMLYFLTINVAPLNAVAVGIVFLMPYLGASAYLYYKQHKRLGPEVGNMVVRRNEAGEISMENKFANLVTKWGNSVANDNSLQQTFVNDQQQQREIYELELQRMQEQMKKNQQQVYEQAIKQMKEDMSRQQKEVFALAMEELQVEISRKKEQYELELRAEEEQMRKKRIETYNIELGNIEYEIMQKKAFYEAELLRVEQEMHNKKDDYTSALVQAKEEQKKSFEEQLKEEQKLLKQKQRELFETELRKQEEELRAQRKEAYFKELQEVELEMASRKHAYEMEFLQIEADLEEKKASIKSELIRQQEEIRIKHEQVIAMEMRQEQEQLERIRKEAEDIRLTVENEKLKQEEQLKKSILAQNENSLLRQEQEKQDLESLRQGVASVMLSVEQERIKYEKDQHRKQDELQQSPIAMPDSSRQVITFDFDHELGYSIPAEMEDENIPAEESVQALTTNPLEQSPIKNDVMLTENMEENKDDLFHQHSAKPTNEKKVNAEMHDNGENTNEIETQVSATRTNDDHRWVYKKSTVVPTRLVSLNAIKISLELGVDTPVGWIKQQFSSTASEDVELGKFFDNFMHFKENEGSLYAEFMGDDNKVSVYKFFTKRLFSKRELDPELTLKENNVKAGGIIYATLLKAN